MTIDREELRRMCEAATPGPWQLETVKTSVGTCHKIGKFPSRGAHSETSACVYADSIHECDIGRSKVGDELHANARLISAARTAVPALLDALEAAEAQLRDTTWQDHADHWQKRAVEAEATLEIVRMQLAACGVIAMANTSESAKVARDMHPDYDCASVRDVADAVDREMTAREKLEAAEAREKRLREAAIELANEHRKKFRSDAVLLRRIDAALADTAP